MRSTSRAGSGMSIGYEYMKLTQRAAGKHLHDVAGEQRVAVAPVQDLAAGEVPAEPQQRQAVPELAHVARPELDATSGRITHSRSAS
jgi:hypothetical protein